MSDYVLPPLPPGLTLRPIAPDDMDYLRWLYHTTRTDLAQAVDWSDEQKRAFSDMQFNQQHQYYHEHFPHVGYYVIERDGEKIGRIYIDWRRGDSLHLMEVTIAPDLRGHGLGTSLMRWLMDEAARTTQRMTLYVEDFNPAYRLYQRLGFKPIGSHGIYTYLEWKPAP